MFRPLLLLALLTLSTSATEIAIQGEDFHLNGQPTYPGRTYQGARIEGLLLNSRMVQATFDDLNPETVSRWAYPDTGQWDPDRNTREFLAAMPAWRRAGLLTVTLNLQGGSPEGYSSGQPWENSAFAPDGSLRPAFMARLALILDRADELGMAVILGYFYFGQEPRVKGEAAILRATDAATAWLLERGDRHVLIEIANETNNRYRSPLFDEARAPELLLRVKAQTKNGRRLLVGTSFTGGRVPWPDVVEASDFLLIHGNGQASPEKIIQLIEKTRRVPTYRPMPVVINEDDHFNFEKSDNNFLASVRAHVSWGYFDFRKKGEPMAQGYQTVPVDWTTSTSRKKAFFKLLAEITGGTAK